MNSKKLNVALAITLGLLMLFGALALLDGLSPVYAENAPDAIAEVVVGNVLLSSNISGTWTHNGTLDEWEQGTPSNAANGAPTHCASGLEGCWVTDLDGNYENSADESLYSPVITVPVTATLPISVTWQQAWYIEDAYYDHAYADYRCNGGTWTNLWQHYSDSQTGSDAAESWQTVPGAPFSLTCGLTDTVQFRFRLTSDSSNNNFPGYYVDDLRLYDAAGKTLYSTQPPEISKTAQQSVIQPGDTVTYTLQMTNTRETSRSLTLVDTLDGNQSPLGALASRGACHIATPGWGGVITCAIPSVQTDERVVVTLTAQSASAISTFNITNSATVSDGLQTASAQASVAVDNCFVRLAAGGVYTGYNTVQAAIDAAAPGNEVQVSGVCGDLFTRHSQTQIGYISKTLTLRGGYNTDFSEHNPAQYPATLDAQGLGRVFYITKTATIEDFTLTGGSSGSNGGAIYADIDSGDALTLRANIIRNNTASANGGGVYVYGGYGSNYVGQVTVQSNTIRSNTANYGGGLVIGRVGQITISGNTFRENTAQEKGGALQLWETDNMQVTDNAVLSNTAHEGGGVFVDNGAYGALVSNTIAYNQATAGNGGGVLQEDSANYTLENNDIYSNTASSNGGGIYALGDSGGVTGPFVYKFNDIAYNHSTDGGGLYIRGNACYASGLMQGNLVRHNTATGDGGGLFMIDCEQLGGFVNNAIINNSAGNLGSGLRIHRPDTANWQMLHNTIGNNSGGDNTGVYIGGGADLVLSDTLIYSQTFGVVVDGNGSSGTLDYTFWDSSVTTRTATTNSGTLIESNALQGDAALSADGYHLPGTSAAVNQGKSNVLNDIDGQSRNDGQPDIGADEYVASVDPALSKARQGSGNVSSGQPITYTLTVSNSAAAEDQVTVILTDTLIPSGAAANVAFQTVGGDNCATNATGFTCTVYNVATDTQRIVTAIVATNPSFEGVVTNTAQLAALTGSETNPANNTAGPVTVTVVAPPPSAPDLWVNKSASAQYLKSGDALTYTLQWGNQGDATASNAVLTDTLPAKVNFVSAEGSPNRNGQILTWNLGNVLSDTNLTYHVVVTAADGLADGTVLTNTATIHSAAAESNTGNNASQAVSTVYDTGGVDLTVTKDALGIVNDETLVGDVVNYRIVISNSGQVSTPFTMTDIIPQGTEFVNVWSEPAGIVHKGNKIEWDYTHALTASVAVTAHLRVKVTDCGGVECGIIRNTASVQVPDISYIWHSPTVDLWVKCPDLAVDVAAPNVQGLPFYLHYNDDTNKSYEWFLTYENINNGLNISLSASPRITLTIDGKAHFDTTDISPVPVEADDQHIIWNLPQLAPGESIDDIQTEDVPSFDIILDGYDKNGYTLHAEIGNQEGLQECESSQTDNRDAQNIPSIWMDFRKSGLSPRISWLYQNGTPTEARFDIGYEMLLQYHNSSLARPMATDMSVLDEWPLPSLDWEDSGLGHGINNEWTFSSLGNELTWDARKKAAEGTRGWIEAHGYVSQTVQPGTLFSNQAILGFDVEDSGAKTYIEAVDNINVEIPLLQPMILKPDYGLQVCAGDWVDVVGIAQAGVDVRVYLNGTLQKTVQPDALGTFTVTITTVPGTNNIEVSAFLQPNETGRAAVTIFAPGNLLWAPYGSSVVGTVDGGPLDGQEKTFDITTIDDFQLPGVYGFSDMSWYLHTCGCPRPATDVMSVTISADNGQYYDEVGASGKWPGIASLFLLRAHHVDISVMCYDPSAPPPPKPGDPDDPSDDDANTQNSSGQVLIDPDGYVFDIDQGGAYDSNLGGMFNPVQAVGGVTVTAYMSAPTWGGWIPWPAHIYNQVNPQVTDSSYPDGITTTGYYAFYTPPGHYYIDVQGGATTEGSPYQEWRSPVIEVITQAVHVNVPYTPLPENVAVSVTVTAQGISSPVITIPVGSAVQWVSSLSASDTITDLIAWGENPILHPKSELDPLLNTNGFDAGFLEPGRVYRRKFAWPGEYAYTDAHGDAGTVVVTGGAEIYLPLIIKN